MTQSKFYRPPLASVASRKINLRSKGHSSGFLMLATPARPWLRQIFYESIKEKYFLMQTAAREDLVDIVEQPPAISFTKPDGRKGHHTFDFLVKLSDGSRIAVAVKPYNLAERQNLRNLLTHVAAAMPKTFATKVFLVTDRDLNADAAREAGRTLTLRNRSLMQEVA